MKITKKMKMLFIIAVALGFAGNALAQNKKATNYDQGFRLGFGLSGGYVFDDPYDFALGADARIQYDLSKRYSFTLTTGFTNMFVTGKKNDLGFIPVKAGFKGFFWEDQFYAMGEAGAGFAITNGYDQTSLILAPSIGYANKYFDVSLRYEYYSDFPVVKTNGLNTVYGEGTGQLAIRLAYGFKL
ncbi:MAG: hypothetical protein H7199_06305 [Burkholderiales bacterium]|nr:hypothetical protein [Flavobacterium sp.]